MKILAIESSCDETAAAVVEDGRKVLSSVIASQVSEHIIYGGVVPEIASRMHAQAISGVVSKAMSDAGVGFGDIDAIAVTYAPGLIGALLVGGAVAWHGIELAGLMRAALPSRFGYTVRYYLAASVILPIGVTLGAWLARGADEATQARLLVAHLCLNVLGWIGLHVLGTLSTLWATMLRTRLPDGAERVARRALPVLLAGVAIAALRSWTSDSSAPRACSSTSAVP